MNVSLEQLRAFRVRRQFLASGATDPLEVVSRLCGVHAQVASSAELTVWARVPDLEPGWAARALWSDRSLVKTWAMRGTLHLLPSAELGLWMGGLSTYRHYLKPVWLRHFGVTREELDELVAGVHKALARRALTREELAAAVGDERLKESWGALLKPAAFQGKLCFAEGEGQRVRFCRPPAFKAIESEEALREIARRYLGAYGPAARQDFARWWSGLSAAQSGKLLASVASEVSLEGAKAFALPEHLDELGAAQPTGTVNLLPAFDQYVAGSLSSLDRLLSPGIERAAISRQAGWLSPVLLVDGLISGVWRHERKGKRLVVSFEPAVRVSGTVRAAAEREAERLASFTGGELSVDWR